MHNKGSSESKSPQSNHGISISRRHFLQVAGTTAIAMGIQRSSFGRESAGEIPRRALGSTGVEVSMIGLGGFHIGKQKDEHESIEIVRTAIDSGISFMDNCWDYNNGQSEVRMGKALRDGYREKVFLMTKIDGRDKQTAARQIEQSLERLQTDRIDLIQVHEVIRENDPERVFAPGGTMEALLEAKKAGKLRFIGFTGHKSPDIHLKMLETARAHSFRFDTVQMPLNVMDAHFNSFAAKVVPLLAREKIGVLGMKPIGSGNILKSETVTATECLHYAMNLPTSVVITGCDSLKILHQALDAARSFRPMDREQVASLLVKTSDAAREGQYEGYKTTRNFDGTYHHPEWLG